LNSRKAVIIVGWLLLALLAYKVSQFDYEYANFDPYEILHVPPVSFLTDLNKSEYKLHSQSLLEYKNNWITLNFCREHLKLKSRNHTENGL
jgi:preprotein translocase subunit Sec63